MKKLFLCLLIFSGLLANAQVPVDTAALRARINAQIVPNGQKAITASQLNQILNGIVNFIKPYAVDSSYLQADTLVLVRKGFSSIKVKLPNATGPGGVELDPSVPLVAKNLTPSDIAYWNSKQGAFTLGPGLAMQNGQLRLRNDSALYNANLINGNPVSSTAPFLNQVLRWNGSAWAPANPPAGSGGGLDSLALSDSLARVYDSIASIRDRVTPLPIGPSLLTDDSGRLDVNQIIVKPYNVLRSYAAFRLIPSGDTTTIWRFNINGNVLDYIWDKNDNSSLDDSAAVLINNGRRFKLYAPNGYNPDWFGAVPNDGLDDSYAFNKCSNYAIKTSSKPKITIGGGTYNVKYWFLHKKGSGGNYAYFSVTVEGATAAYKDIPNTTTLVTTDGAGFTLGYQQARNIVIRGINFVGPVAPVSSFKDLVERDINAWTSGGTISNNRYAPNAGIVSEPVHATVAVGNRYPGMTAFYTNTANEATSLALIEGCTVQGYMVGVMLNPSGTNINGDNTVFMHGKQGNNRSFWAAGQTQSRGNFIFDLYSLGNTEFLVNANEYGYGTGTPPNIAFSNLAGGHKYLYRLSPNYGFSGMSLDHVYTESLFSLGYSGNLPVTYVDCQIKMAIPTAYNTFASRLIAEGGHVNFIGGSLEYFDNEFAGPFMFKVSQLSFTGTYIAGNIPIISGYDYGRPTYNNVRFRDHIGGPGGIAYLTENQSISNYPLNLMNDKRLLSGTEFTTEGTGIRYKMTGDKIDNILMEVATIKVSGLSVYFVSSDADRYAFGDLLTTYNQNVSWSNDIYSASNVALGYVERRSADTVFLKYSPYGLVNNTSFNIYLKRIAKFTAPTIANSETGSAILSGVQRELDATTFVPGNYIKGPGIRIGARVLSVSNDTIIMSLPALATANRIELYDMKYQVTARSSLVSHTNSTKHVWRVGDVVESDVSGSNQASFYVSVNGQQGSANLPTFLPVGEAGHAKLAGTNNFTGRAVYPSLTTNSNIQLGSLHFQSRDTASFYMMKGAYYDGTNYRYTHTNMPATRIFFGTDGVFGFSTAPGGAAGSVLTWSSKLYGLRNGAMAFGGGITNTAGVLGGSYFYLDSIGGATFPLLTGSVNEALGITPAGKIYRTAFSGGGSGDGGITTVGNLSPLFTTSETATDLTFSLTSQTANRFFAAPNGSNGAPTFRIIDVADLPEIPGTKLTDGTVGMAKMNATGTRSSSTYLRGDGVWSVPGSLTLANAETNGLLSMQNYSYLFERGSVTDPTSPLAIDMNVLGQLTVNLTTSGGKTLSLSNVGFKSLKIVINNTHSAGIVITLPANSFVRNSSGAYVSAASFTVPVGLYLVTMDNYDGTNYMWSTSF